MTDTRESILHAEVSAGDDDAWPDTELLLVHELNELGAGIEAPTVDLSSMTKAELLDLADDRGIDIPSGAKKAEVLAALEDS